MARWRSIDPFPGYEVSEEGAVRNGSTGHVLKQVRNTRSGFWWVPLRHGGKQHTRMVHKLVALAFFGEPMQGYIPRHVDGDKDNNHYRNLEYVTLSSAREYTMDRKRLVPRDLREVTMVDQGITFPNALTAARDLNGLERQILYAARTGGSYKRSRWEFS